MKQYRSLSLVLLFSYPLIGMDEPAVSDIIPTSKSVAQTLSTEKETEAQLMKLLQNADSMCDALVNACPVILPWLKQPTAAFNDLPLVASTDQLRHGTNVQDCLLRNHELEKIYTTTQAFARLHTLISVFTTAKSTSPEHASVFEQFYREKPEHRLNDFMRIFTPLQGRILNLVEKYSKTNETTSNQKGS